ncbi:MAG TPA: TIGR00730 family Rossman fold protein [Xanthomonadaceae bacterium]|nr:TIGR00730 family Rossman fold protein [Xanthomonadaceae bacterium]
MRASIAVFCGAKAGSVPAYAHATAALGKAIAASGRTLVYGGGRVGLMGTLADAALAVGGRVIGVIPRGMVDLELAHPGLSHLEVVATMHERKAAMSRHADAFVAAPGGFGTLDELFEAVTWTQLGIQRKPIGLFDVGGFYAPLRQMVASLVTAGFVDPKHAAMIVSAGTAEGLLAGLDALELPLPRSEVAAGLSA